MSKIASSLNFKIGSDTNYVDLIAAEYDAEFSRAEKRVHPSKENFCQIQKRQTFIPLHVKSKRLKLQNYACATFAENLI